MVPTGRRDLDAPAGRRLTADVAEVDAVARRERAHRPAERRLVQRRIVGRLRARLPGQGGQALGQRRDPDDVDARDQAGLGDVRHRHDHSLHPGIGRREYGGQDARHRSQPAVEHQLAERTGADAAHRREHLAWRPAGPARSPGRSACPTFGTSAGYIATVIRRSGHGWPLLTIADRQRSRASLTLTSASPVSDQEESPSLMSASIETTRPRTPSRATEYAIPVVTSAHPDQVPQLGRPAAQA